LVVSLAALSCPPFLGAQIRVTLTPPKLAAIGAELTRDLLTRQQVEAFLSGPLDSLQVQAAQRLEGALDKPLVFSGWADAVTLPLLAFGRPVWDASVFTLALGLAAGVQTDSFDPELIARRMKTLDPHQDYRLGASADPLVASLTMTPFPGEWSWSLGLLGGWSRVSYAPVALTTGAFGTLGSLRWNPGGERRGWKGLTLSAGLGWTQNLYETTLTVALPTQVIAMDLTYVSDTVTIAANPVVNLSLSNRGWFFPVQLSTEWTLFQTLGLGLSAGGVLSQGWSSLGLQGNSVVHLSSKSGILTKFIEDTAAVSVEGSVTGTVGPWWQGFLGVTPVWSVGAFRFGVPLTFRYPGGLAAALAWGMAL